MQNQTSLKNTPADAPAPASSPLSEEQIRKLLELLELPPERAHEGPEIFIPCPFAHLHTKPTRERDCILYFDVVPHVWCFHESCAEERQGLNSYLRLTITGSTEFPDTPHTRPVPRTTGSFVFEKQVAGSLPKLIAKFLPAQWPLEPITMTAPDFLRRLKVFKPDDLIWIGRKTSSGAPIHRIHFRTLARWKPSPPPPAWCYTAGAVFRPGSFSRSKSNVLAVRALILESDSLPPRETFAMARWVEDEFSVPLLACVHSGAKSLHCYFKHPDPNFKHGWLDQWGPALVAAGFDRRTLSPSQPIRLAGQRREDTGAAQELLWLRPVKTRKSKSR